MTNPGVMTIEAPPYTVAEVAAHLRVQPRKVRELIHQGEIEGFKVGSEFRITPEALEAYKRPRPTPPAATGRRRPRRSL